MRQIAKVFALVGRWNNSSPPSRFLNRRLPNKDDWLRRRAKNERGGGRDRSKESNLWRVSFRMGLSREKEWGHVELGGVIDVGDCSTSDG
jgi:hypothetical protein